jgi:sugar phosphate permease
VRAPRRQSRRAPMTSTQPPVRPPTPVETPVATGVPARRPGVYYGWWILGGSVVAMALGSGVSFWAFGLYVEPLEAEFGWSRAGVSLAFSLALLASGFAGPLVGRWIDVRGPRSAIIVGAVLTALSYVLLATTQSLWQWYVYSALNAVVRQLMFFMPFMALIPRWFDRRRGMAISILGSGFSLGGFAVVPLMGFVIAELGWRGGMLFSAAVVAALFIPLGVWLIRNDPADVGASMDGRPPEPLPDGQVRVAPGLTLGQALRTPQFWVLSFALTLFFYGMFGWLVHQVPFYMSVGISLGAATGLVSLTAGLGIVSRICMGLLADRVRRFESVAMALAALLTASMVALWLDSGAVGIGVFVAFWIAGSSGGPLMEAMLLTRNFGVTHFGSILGAMMVIEMGGQILSPTIAGAIFDATGGYDATLLMFAGTYLGALVLFALARRMPPPAASPPS